MRAPGRGERESAGDLGTGNDRTSRRGAVMSSRLQRKALAAAATLRSKPLNVYAEEFVPKSTAFQNGGRAEERRSDLLPGSPGGHSFAAASETSLADLPDEVLSLIFSGLGTASLVSLAQVCTRFQSLLRDLPVSIAAYPSGLKDICTGPGEMRSRLQGISRLFAGLGKLDLSNSPVGDSEVLDAIHQLRSLQVLRLSGCKKLTTALVCSPSHAAKLCQLSSLCLQRCYQLEASTLTCLLAATAEADARLTLLIMSHLVLSQWPGGPAQLGADGMPIPPQPTVAVPASRLQILGLNNCMRVGAAALSTIASTCSQLQVLLLGGCTLSNGDVQSLHNPADCKICREQLASLRARASATTVTSKASQLAGLALHLEDLAVLELTHTVTPMEMVALRDVLRLGNCRTHCISLCSSLDTQMVSLMLAEARSQLRMATGCYWRPMWKGIIDWQKLSVHQLELATEAAVNCSSMTRHTALHLAAADGRHESVEALLRMGARSDAADRSGATPLFSACESGHLACVRSLLAAGAPVSRCNTAGEAPLYIAALRGHEACVQVLLQHLLAHELPWMDKELYGDCWTPLMAAAVADHCGIVVLLLEAAGVHARTLVKHTNRNGLTAAHVAARRGCVPVLQRLLVAAGGGIATTPDHMNRTPIKVAEQHKQWAAAGLLRAAIKAAC